MIEPDIAEPDIPAKETKRKRFWTADRVIGYSGAALALTAAFFPWYVFFNSAKFGINATVSMISRNFPGWSERKTFSQTPTAFTNNGIASKNPDAGDPILTGTVPGLDETKVKGDPDAVDQPFPNPGNNFHLLHVAKGKALIEDENGVYVVEPGSPLPDQSKVASFEERDGEWVLMTDKGDIYDADGKRK
jgi:hypothetical protein